MKKILVFFICTFIFGSLFQTIVLADTELASQLKELGMFIGVGENDDGTTDFDLDRAPTRAEALAMLIRALGKDGAAAAYPKTHPFTDVPEWADRYVSYAYDNGLTSGVSDTQFSAGAAVTKEMYLTFVLRALGYTDGDDADFYWDSPWALAAWCGLFPMPENSTDFLQEYFVNSSSFLRNDLVTITGAALYANLKGAQITLYEHLIAEDAFTAEQFRKAFPDDPFSVFRSIDRQISTFIGDHEHLGSYNDYTYAMETHIITDITQADGALEVSVLLGMGIATLGEEDIESFSWQTDLWLVTLDVKTLQYRSCLKSRDVVEGGHALEEYFSESTLNVQPQLIKGMNGVGRLVTQAQMGSGQLQ